MGYDEVLPVRASTRADIDDGLRTAVQKVAGTTKALLMISYSGHAVEVDSRMMWAPESANHDDMGTHFDASCLCRDLMEVHLPDGIARFGATEPAKNLFAVLLADCCRDPSAGNHCDPLRSTLPQRRRGDRGGLYVIYSCGPGLRAYDEHSSGHSPFVHFVQEQLRLPQRVGVFADNVDAGLRRATGGKQWVWHLECGGSGSFRSVSLATVAICGRARSGSVLSLLTETSQPEVTQARAPEV